MHAALKPGGKFTVRLVPAKPARVNLNIAFTRVPAASRSFHWLRKPFSFDFTRAVASHSERIFSSESEDIPYAAGARAATEKIRKTKRCRMDAGVALAPRPHEYDDPHTWIGEIGDVLVIDTDGKPEGREVTELLQTLLPAVAKRPTP